MTVKEVSAWLGEHLPRIFAYALVTACCFAVILYVSVFFTFLFVDEVVYGSLLKLSFVVDTSRWPYAYG